MLKQEWGARLQEMVGMPHAQLYFQIQAARNYEKSALQQCLIECLEQDGHNVTVVEVEHDDQASSEYKAIKQEILEEESQAIFEADLTECG